MARVSKIENNSHSDVKVQLTGGSEVTIPPNTTMENVDIENIGDLKSKVKVTEDLTEVGLPQGKTRIDG
ncbi:MAG: hypothetical protein ACTSU7_15135 [Candidatus Heimdallarchaeaceae archaeon]